MIIQQPSSAEVCSVQNQQQVAPLNTPLGMRSAQVGAHHAARWAAASLPLLSAFLGVLGCERGANYTNEALAKRIPENVIKQSVDYHDRMGDYSRALPSGTGIAWNDACALLQLEIDSHRDFREIRRMYESFAVEGFGQEAGIALMRLALRQNSDKSAADILAIAKEFSTKLNVTTVTAAVLTEAQLRSGKTVDEIHDIFCLNSNANSTSAPEMTLLMATQPQ